MIRVIQPKMPKADDVLPYLREIDENGIHTNNGPLVQRLEARLSTGHYEGKHVIAVANCTLGLELVWRTVKSRNAVSALIPALTFPATALAAQAAGFDVVLDDVSSETWVSGGVSGFGRQSYGSPLDAAGAFGEQHVEDNQLAVFSMHATKPLGCGEGGFIVTKSEDYAYMLKAARNFGIGTKRYGTNAKMSEYHAAVAHAALDIWNRDPWLQLFDWYEKYLPKCVTAQSRERGVYPMMPVKLPCDPVYVMGYLAAKGIETRRWYYPCLAEHPLFKLDGWREKLPVTADLSDHLLGLPYHLFLTEDDVAYICQSLEKAIQ